ncbi:MAG: DUF3592 domain-containing protein [Lachnospiraceae bacterium]|nr:DUF3592 domain-containing protein [Lachnospiraceae bacterium]
MRINIDSSKSDKAGKAGILVFIILGSIFLLIGIGQIVMGFFFLKFGEKTDDYVKIKAVISEIVVDRDSDGDTDYEVFVDYTYDGVTYGKKPFNMYSSSMYEGKEIDILCDPDNPEKITYEGSHMLPSIILFILGGVFSLVAIILLIVMACVSKNSKDGKKKLEKKGVRVSATVEEVRVDEQASANGNIAYRIICVYNDEVDNIMYRYKSDVLFDDPSGFYYKGASIDVLINPEDPGDYHVIVEHMQTTKVVDFV